MQHKRLRALGLGRVRSGMFWSVVLLNILSSYFCSILLAILPIILLYILLYYFTYYPAEYRSEQLHWVLSLS